MRRALLVLALALAPAVASADPPHAIVEVKPGDPAFERLFGVRVLAVADPSIASAELMPSQEVLVTGKKPGTTTVVAIAGGKLVGIRVHVREPGAARPDQSGAAELAAALKACPKHQLVGEGADQELGAVPEPAACRTALAALFATDHFVIKQISVDFDQPALQLQLAEMEKAVKTAGLDGVSLAYQAATLVVKGTLSRAEAAKLALALYGSAVGGVPLDDTELLIEEPDAGPPVAPLPPVITIAPR